MVTNFPTPITASVKGLLGDDQGYAILASGTGAAPTTADVFQHGCLYYRTDSGTGVNAVYQNTGSIAVPSWTLVDTGVAFSVPTDATDATSTTTEVFHIIASALTTGALYVAQVVGATLTGAGRYFAARDVNNGEVFGIGPNGHIVSTATTTANATTTALIRTNGGITAVTLAAGSTDTAGKVTGTGTQANSTDSEFTVTFGRAYDAVPKSVVITPGQTTTTSIAYIVPGLVATTSFVVGITKGLGANTTPVYYYTVIG